MEAVEKKMNNIEREIISLKLLLMKLSQKKKKESVSINGLLKGVTVTEEDLKEANDSLFRQS